jgi:hypothetical protein
MFSGDDRPVSLGLKPNAPSDPSKACCVFALDFGTNPWPRLRETSSRRTTSLVLDLCAFP